MKILLDTNFLIIPGKFKVDIFSELAAFGKPELYTLDLIVRELEGISRGKGKDARNAHLGLHLIVQKQVTILKATGKAADSQLANLAMHGYAVATQDRDLQKVLKNQGSEVIHLRQGRYLEKL